MSEENKDVASKVPENQNTGFFGNVGTNVSNFGKNVADSGSAVANSISTNINYISFTHYILIRSIHIICVIY